MSPDSLNGELLRYLQQSPSPFHAVANLVQMLDQAGFQCLDEADSWSLQKGKSYYVLRNDSALVAFRTGNGNLLETGLRLSGTHTDSPCLKVKPTPESDRQGYLQLGVEVYGSALFYPWFDRDLSIAGRVHYENDAGDVHTVLVDLEEPVAYIPSLAIHLDREANNGHPINAQTELPPLLLQLDGEEKFSLDDYLLELIKDKGSAPAAARLLSHELFLYDTQAPALVGLRRQFLASARLDNLLSCFVACKALLASDDEHCSVLVCNDHEEVGSASTSGAQGPFLKSVLDRLVAASHGEGDAMDRIIHRSLFLSVDNAHGVHPNYADKHDEQHRPLLNRGPVIKINANQRYASNSQSIAQFKSLCNSQDVPYQNFVMRSDLACGSTIGPLTAAELGITTVDVGVASFGMHSIRELAGAEDTAALLKVVTAFYRR